MGDIMRMNGMGVAAVWILGPALAGATSAAFGQVRVTEKIEEIPTYIVQSPDPNPQFYFGASSQGAEKRIYPYALDDNLTTDRKLKAYKVVYLENEYIRVGIIPELGGKIFSAIDKTNGYEFIYHQHVIKPALITLLGAWISGGIEWDIPHHHRATSLMPVQYTTSSASDGSKTVWVGELELRDRMRWAVGITLHPGKAYLEAAFRIDNPGTLPATMLCFSNVAVSVNASYQIIFPPDTQLVTYHGKRSFTTWPVAKGRYAGSDFGSGVDVSWYKNHVDGNSMFAWNYKDDFFAGYDHGRNAGIMSIADHNTVPGKKFFTWGNGPAGRSEEHLLTENDGPYIELMVGAFSDNQPDYSWLAPHETREWKQYWYPFHELDGVSSANLDAAVNLTVKEGKVRVAFYATAVHPAARMRLLLGEKVLLDDRKPVGPASPYVATVPLPQGTDEHDLTALLSDGEKALITYQPPQLAPPAPPTAVIDPPPPDRVGSVEELYLEGLRIEQFHAPGKSPLPYWQEALRRDPGNAQVNTAMGIRALRGARYAEAESYLKIAIDRVTHDYTRPREGEAFYYLGLALKGEGRIDDAYSQFQQAAWSAEWKGQARFEIAEIESFKSSYDAALDDVSQALQSNELDLRSLALKSALLRHMGQRGQATSISERILDIDPLDPQGLCERWLAAPSSLTAAEMNKALTAFPDTALEVAASYQNAGLWQDGAEILTEVKDKSPVSGATGLMDYYLAYFEQRLDHKDSAVAYRKTASLAPLDYAFPFQFEMEPVLTEAMEMDRADSHAPYLLGNLLYDWQPDRATKLWEESAERGATYPVVYHELAVAYRHADRPEAEVQAMLEKAAGFGGNGMVFSELDQLYEENGVPPEKRLAVLEQHQSVLTRDEIIAREIGLYNDVGKPQQAQALIHTRFFRAWEGGARFDVGDSWINSGIILGRQMLTANHPQEALTAFQSALKLPTSLEEAGGDPAARAPEIAYWTAIAYEKLGDQANARNQFELAAAPLLGTTSQRGHFSRSDAPRSPAGSAVNEAQSYYQALAMQKLGEDKQADAIFEQMISTGTRTLANYPEATAKTLDDRETVATAHYLVGLGEAGLHQQAEAQKAFRATLSICPDYLGALLAVGRVIPDPVVAETLTDQTMGIDRAGETR
jgi:tetratricopeptide (TPR) repeat protein